LQLKQCDLEKEDEQLILSILAKLGPAYSVYVSTFYATMDAFGSKFTMPSLEEFATQLTREQVKLLHMGTLKSPRK